MSKQRVLIVDDEPDIRELLEITLLRMGLATKSAPDFGSAKDMLENERFDLCLTDMKLPDGDGIALVDFVSKPVSLDTLRSLVEKALTLPSKSVPLDNSEDARFRIIGSSPSMLELKQSIAKFARSQAPVFIYGQSGTGKELVAKQIHLQGSRNNAPFIAVNCGAIPAELMESEFFGHIKGSFTGASSDNEGLFRAAHGGTLFLDEIADLPLAMQVKLLRVIQEKSIRAVGSQQEQAVDVRIISASHKDLDGMVTQGGFRQDLYYRINVIGIAVPPLRERIADIADLCDYLIDSHNRENQSNISISDTALKSLQAYSFPGNVRELENMLERASALCEGESIQPADLQIPEIQQPANDAPTKLGEMTQNLEKEQIIQALESNRWNQSASARALGMTLRQLRYRIDKLKLNKS